jgi:hypothetical protein
VHMGLASRLSRIPRCYCNSPSATTPALNKRVSCTTMASEARNLFLHDAVSCLFGVSSSNSLAAAPRRANKSSSIARRGAGSTSRYTHLLIHFAISEFGPLGGHARNGIFTEFAKHIVVASTTKGLHVELTICCARGAEWFLSPCASLTHADTVFL